MRPNVNSWDNRDWYTEGMTSLQLLDRVIAECGRRGLYVLLDRHQYEPGGSNGDKWISPDQGIGVTQWIADWVTLANRYKGNSSVIGADLHNEPHTPAVTWSQWAAWCEQCGNAIHAVNPDWLIVVEGIEVYNNDWFWWGGNLQGVKDRPVRLTQTNKVVYSPHEYGPGVYYQSWFNAPDFPRNMQAIYDKQWRYIHTQGLAPLLIGEFGGRATDTTSKEGIWQNNFVQQIKNDGLSSTYWCLNPNSGDTGGLLLDDWVTPNQPKLDMLRPLFAGTAPTPTPPTPTPPAPTPPAPSPTTDCCATLEAVRREIYGPIKGRMDRLRSLVPNTK